MSAEDNVILPLAWNGSKLSIQQASAAQDGYLSRDAFVLFSGGTIVPVTSFNMRTGEVVLLEDDVLAALGYVPFSKQGDTMTGPLRLSRDPVLADEAATRAYVLAHAGSGVRGVWYITDFNASGSVTRFTGAITSGTKILTLTTSSHDFQVGQGICILGAGAIPSHRGGYFVSQITAISGAQITLQDLATSTATATTDNVQHDDTVAIQSAINAVLNDTTGGGTLMFPDGYYRINKGFTDFNSILKIPYVAATAASKTIFFKGVSPWRGAFLGPISTTGIQIKTELINTSGSMLSGGIYNGPNGNPNTENITSIWMERINWITYDNPQINGVDLGMLGQFCQLKEVQVVTDAPTLGGLEPTHGTFALRLPQNSFSATSLLDLVLVGYNNIGVIASEQMDAWRLYVTRCKIAVQFQPGYHLSRGHITPFQCPRLIDVPGTAPGYADIRLDLTMDIEVGGDAWMLPDPAGEIYDPNNAAKGRLAYMALNSGSGLLTTITKTGGTFLTVSRIT